jgi:plastocyanin
MRSCAALLLALACSLQPGVGGAATAAPAIHTVVVEGMAFSPATLTVRQGDVVVWVNKDLFPHTATAQDRSFDSGEIAAGKNWRYVARKTGTLAYVCSLHPTMKAALIVK